MTPEYAANKNHFLFCSRIVSYFLSFTFVSELCFKYTINTCIHIM